MKRLSILLLAVATLFLSACSTQSSVDSTPTFPSLQELRVNYVTILAKNGAKIERVNNTFTISIPSRLLFFKDSANFHAHADDVLLTTAKLIRSYRSVNVRVAGFSDTFGGSNVQTALAKLQAENVANRLWSLGLDARLIYAVGFNNQENSDHRAHIEIKFKVYPYPYPL